MIKLPKIRLFVLCLSLVSATALRADDAEVIAAVRAADDERVAAILAADPVRLDAIFSDQLRYGHSNGKVDDKASFVQSLTSRKTIYESFNYQERAFTVAGPGVVLMTGRVIARAISAGPPVALDLNFLAAWREEHGRWRFLAWQSAKLAPPVAK